MAKISQSLFGFLVVTATLSVGAEISLAGCQGQPLKSSATYRKNAGLLPSEWKNTYAALPNKADTNFKDILTHLDELRIPNTSNTVKPKIYHGPPVTDDRFRSTVGITRAGGDAIQCSGTIIESDVVLTAGHCICEGISGEIVIGNNINGQHVSVKRRGHFLRECDVINKGSDLGLLLLSQAVAVTPAKFQSDAVVDTAKTYEVIGFGAYDVAIAPGTNGPPEAIGAGLKRNGPVAAATDKCDRNDACSFGCAPNEEIVAGNTIGSGIDTCLGDSGSGIWTTNEGRANSDPGTLELAGVTSRGTTYKNRLCGDGGLYVRLTSEKQQAIRDRISQMR